MAAGSSRPGRPTISSRIPRASAPRRSSRKSWRTVHKENLMKRFLTTRSGAALLALAFLAMLAPSAAVADNSLEAIKQRGFFKIGVKYDAPNFGYLTPGAAE